MALITKKGKTIRIYELGAVIVILAVLSLNVFNAVSSDKTRNLIPDMTNIDKLNEYISDFDVPKNSSMIVGTLIQHLENNTSFTMDDLKPHLENKRYVYIPSDNEFAYVDENFEYYQTGASPEDNTLVGEFAYQRYGVDEAVFHLNTYKYDTHKFDENGSPVIITYVGYNMSFPE